jgi:hypothetical protein
MIKKNKTMDDVFLRLYNDFEKRGEKKESLISYYMPPFKPTISKYKKFINKRKNNKTDIFITNFDKNNFFLNSQISINKNCFLQIINKSKGKKQSKHKCCYCTNEIIKNGNKKNSKYNSVDTNSIFAYKSTNDNTFQNNSGNNINDFGSITNSYTLNKTNMFDQSLTLETIQKKKNKKIINLKKGNIYQKINKGNNGITNEKQIIKQHIFKKNWNNFNNSYDNYLHYNKSFEIYNNNDNNKYKYKSFFDFDNIDEL